VELIVNIVHLSLANASCRETNSFQDDPSAMKDGCQMKGFNDFRHFFANQPKNFQKFKKLNYFKILIIILDTIFERNLPKSRLAPGSAKGATTEIPRGDCRSAAEI
jgi:hypothetical protein